MSARRFVRFALLLCLATILRFAWHHPSAPSAECALPASVRNDSIALLALLAHAPRYAEPAHASIDSVDGKPAPGSAPVEIPSGRQFDIQGWAEDDAAKAPANLVIYVLDGKMQLPDAADCMRRLDVARAANLPSLADAGFRARVDTKGLAVGSRHSIDFFVVDARARGVWRGPSAKMVIVPAARDLRSDAGSHIMTIETIGDFFYNAKQPIPIPADRDLRVTGWAGAIDRDDSFDTTVVATLDGNPIGLAIYGAPRADVAAYFHAPSLEKSGFSARIPLDGVAAGVHRVTIETRRTADAAPRSSSTVLIQVIR